MVVILIRIPQSSLTEEEDILLNIITSLKSTCTNNPVTQKCCLSYTTLYTVSLSGLVSIQVHATYFTVNIIFHLGKRLLEIASFVPSLILDNNLEMNNNYELSFWTGISYRS